MGGSYHEFLKRISDILTTMAVPSLRLLLRNNAVSLTRAMSGGSVHHYEGHEQAVLKYPKLHRPPTMADYPAATIPYEEGAKRINQKYNTTLLLGVVVFVSAVITGQVSGMDTIRRDIGP